MKQANTINASNKDPLLDHQDQQWGIQQLSLRAALRVQINCGR
jgi:hypothetical protein